MKSKIVFLTFFALFFLTVTIVPIASAENITPYITIDPVGNHTIDEVFFINGTTNLPANESLSIEIYSSSFNPGGGWSGYMSNNVSIQPGENGINTLSCNATTSLWETFGIEPHRIPTPDAVPGEYVVNVYAPSGPTAPEQLVLIFPGVPSVYTVPVAEIDYYGNRTTEPIDMVPLTVQFVDESENTPTSWLWTFGDGSTSTSQNPLHTYTSAGTYTVTLTATNPAGSNTSAVGLITTSNIPVSATTTEISPPQAVPQTPPVASFTYTTTNQEIPSATPTPNARLDAMPVLGALAVCGVIFLFRRNRSESFSS